MNQLKHFIKADKGWNDEKATDLEMAIFLGKHIDKPCSTTHGHIRGFYIREAEKLLPTFHDQKAKDYLNRKITQYKND